jgi:predicted NBD/HSP70 family sugar kinase
VSEQAICEAIGRRTGTPTSSIKLAAQMATNGDEAAIFAFQRAGDVLGRALSMVLNLLNPSRVILFAVGELTDTKRCPASAEQFLNALDDAVRTSAFSFAADQLRLIPRTVSRRTVDEELGARGAASALLARMLVHPPTADRRAAAGHPTARFAASSSPIS